MASYLLAGFKRLISFAKKAFIVIAVYCVVISLFSLFINRDRNKLFNDQTSKIERNRQEIYKIIDDKELNKTKEGKLTVALYRATLCGFIGEACTNNPSDGDKNFNNSLLGQVTGLITLPLSHPPASGVMWAYTGLQSAGFVPKTMAAEGIGFSAIAPFANLWKVLRDISYMLLVIVLIAIGFMIMFRAKANPQTVINVENALPRIVMAMILITFSFAIAGFMIDLMYLFIALIISQLTNANIGVFNPGNKLMLLNKYSGASFTDLFPFPFNLYTVGNSLYTILPQALRDVFQGILGLLLNILIVKGVNTMIGADKAIKGMSDIQVQAATFGLGIGNTPIWASLIFDIVFIGLTWKFGIVAIAISLIIGILILCSIIFLMFRIFFLLLSTYIKILLLIIFAPFLLLFEAIPGRSAFSYWFKNLLGNLITFPVVITLIVVGGLLSQVSTSNSNLWNPPFIYGFDPNSFATLLGLGIILLIPDLVKTTKDALGVKDMPFSIGLGTYFSGAGAAVGGSTGLLGQFSSINLGLSALGLGGKGGLFGLFGKAKGGIDANDIAEQVHKRLTNATPPTNTGEGTVK